MTVPIPSPEQRDRGARMRTLRRMAVASARRGRKITTKHPAVCDACGHPVPVGESAWWSQGAGVVHDDPGCLAGLGIDEYRPAPLSERDAQERDEYALGRLEDGR